MAAMAAIGLGAVMSQREDRQVQEYRIRNETSAAAFHIP